MPTILTHPAVPIALAAGLGRQVIPARLLIAGVAVSILPDMDVIAFCFGIPYHNAFGHRGFSHSLLFALLVALMGACFFRWYKTKFKYAFWFLFAAAASHGILDAFTNGGLGIAFLWPWSQTRFFAPVQVIEVAPIGFSSFFSEEGSEVLLSELIWVWLPLMSIACILFLFRRAGREKKAAA